MMNLISISEDGGNTHWTPTQPEDLALRLSRYERSRDTTRFGVRMSISFALLADMLCQLFYGGQWPCIARRIDRQ